MRIIFSIVFSFLLVFSLFSQEIEERDYMYAFTEATKQKLFGNTELAERQFLELARIQSVPAVFYQLSLIELSRSNYRKAKRYMELAESKDSTNIFYKKKLAAIYETLGMRDSLIMVFERIVTLQEQYDIETALLYTQLLFLSNQHQKVVSFIYEIEEQYGIIEDFVVLQLNSYLQLDSINYAIEKIKKLIALNPTNVNYVLELANYHQINSQYDSALNVLYSIYENHSDNQDVLLSLASNYRLKGKLSKTYAYYNNYLSVSSIPLDNKYSLVYTLYSDDSVRAEESANIAELLTNFSELYSDNLTVLALAIEFYYLNDDLLNLEKSILKAIALDSVNYSLWEQLFYIYYDEFQYDKLYTYTSKALLLFDDKLNLLILHAISALQAEQYNDAIQSLNKAQLLDFDNDKILVTLLTFLGDAYRELAYHAISDQYYEKALAIDPNNLLVRNNYAYFLALRNERLDYAQELSRYTIRRDTRNPHYLDTYGWILYQQGRLRLARWYIRRAINNMDNSYPSAEVYNHYADIALDFGQIDKALTYWKKAYTIDSSPEIYYKIISYDPNFK